jgi:hypothetical protein
MNNQISQMEVTEKRATFFHTKSCRRNINIIFEGFGKDVEVSNNEHELAVNVLQYAIIFVFVIEMSKVTVGELKYYMSSILTEFCFV